MDRDSACDPSHDIEAAGYVDFVFVHTPGERSDGLGHVGQESATVVNSKSR